MKEILFSDLANLCLPQTHISEDRMKDKWCVYTYETAHISGNMLIAMPDSYPEDIVFSPGLFGWYHIFAGLYTATEDPASIELKLSSDAAFMTLGTSAEEGYASHIIEDVFWRSCELHGDSIHIGKHLSFAQAEKYTLAWFRFVPMTEEEIAAYKTEKERKDTKRIYAANDMHNMLCTFNMRRRDAWKSVAANCIDSDIEWLAIENLAKDDGGLACCDTETFSFDRGYDKSFAEQWSDCFSYDTLKNLVVYGKSLGLKMCISMRSALWCMEFPYDKIFFDHRFTKEHTHLRCIDRDGEKTEYLSYIYPEVQEYLISEFVRMAEAGADAVQPLFSRGWPYILFEKPFTDLFLERYKEDASVLPLDDERIIALKCEIMTDFMRKLRKRLPAQTELHAKVLFSVYDNRLMGLDVEAWAKEGLVDRIVCDERRIREVLPASIMENGKINLPAYTKYARESLKPAVRYDYDDIFPPFPDSKGILQGPISQKERISEFMELEKYGITVYIEIMPRNLSPEEIKRKANEIYVCGGEHIGLWDVNSRMIRTAEWNVWRHIGHKEDIDAIETKTTLHRVLKIGGRNVRNYKPMWGG